MMRIFNAFCAFATVIGVAAAPAAAEPREIAVRAGAKYAHKPTKITLPPAIGPLARQHVASLDVGDLDVIVDYRSPDGREITTVFLYRNAVGDVPLWFDRATAVIEKTPAKYGKVTAELPAGAFTPPRQTSPSGLRAVYATTAAGWTSTALALLPVRDFYVKLRLSTATLTPAQLETRLNETLSAISWPGKIAPAPAAVPITPCDSALVFAGQAKPARKDGAAALIGAMMPTMSDALEKAGTGRATAVRYCRDPRAIPNAGLYRPIGDNERYVIAFQDAGRALVVGKNDLASLVSAGDGEQAAARYSVDLVLLSENQGYGDFESLPPPEQAIALLESSRPIYTTSTIGKKNNITIAAEALEDE